MACATLKRSYDFDPLVSPSQLQRSPKRRRCGPSIVTSPVQTTKQAKPSPFIEKTPTFSSGIILYSLVHNQKNLISFSPWLHSEITGREEIQSRALLFCAVSRVGLGPIIDHEKDGITEILPIARAR